MSRQVRVVSRNGGSLAITEVWRRRRLLGCRAVRSDGSPLGEDQVRRFADDVVNYRTKQLLASATI